MDILSFMTKGTIKLLPFLKAKPTQTGVIIQERHNSEPEMEPVADEEMEALEECVKDLLVAFAFKDIKKIAESIKYIHDVLHMNMDSESNNETYAAQNASAYKQE